MNKRKTKSADEFFAEEIKTSGDIERKDVEKGAKLTYRDGFRLGFGFFVGFAAASLIVVLIVYLVSMIFKVL
jgi:hypothetical protein